jgi:hypothetical protein
VTTEVKATDPVKKQASISHRVEVPGVRPAAFRLRWKAEDSYDLYRSSRTIGTARVEENGEWTARFDHGKKSWRATGGSADDLLQLVGTFVLAREAKESRPTESDLPMAKVSAAERRLSSKWQELQERRRVASLDALIKEARKRVIPSRG